MNRTTSPFSLRSWSTRLKSLLRWLTATPHADDAGTRQPAITLRSQLIFSTPKAAPHPVKSRPLRVLQVVETGHGGGLPPRLRISGRMADVCAELDRLAAREALQG